MIISQREVAGVSAAVPRAEEGGSTDGGAVVENPSGAGPWVLVCEHAGNWLPPDFGDLGLAPELLTSHIAWDPGALAVARGMARILDAPLVAQLTSRLIYDCNRPPDSDGAMPEISEVHRVPGNAGLSPAQRDGRTRSVYVPFRDTVAAGIDRQCRAVGDVAVVTVHSFTPVYRGVRRAVEVGILHDADARLADAVLAAADDDLAVRRNQPYGPADGVTHTLRTHALPRGLANVMIEVRNDLVADAAQQDAMAARLARWLMAARAG